MDISKELAKELLTTIKGAKEAAGAVKDFTLEQAPDVVHQLLTYNLAVALVWALFGATLIGIAIKLIIVSINSDDSDVSFFAFIGMVVTGMPGTACFITNIATALKVWLAPKLYLLEYFTKIVGN